MRPSFFRNLSIFLIFFALNAAGNHLAWADDLSVPPPQFAGMVVTTPGSPQLDPGPFTIPGNDPLSAAERNILRYGNLNQFNAALAQMQREASGPAPGYTKEQLKQFFDQIQAASFANGTSGVDPLLPPNVSKDAVDAILNPILGAGGSKVLKDFDQVDAINQSLQTMHDLVVYQGDDASTAEAAYVSERLEDAKVTDSDGLIIGPMSNGKRLVGFPEGTRFPLNGDPIKILHVKSDINTTLYAEAVVDTRCTVANSSEAKACADFQTKIATLKTGLFLAANLSSGFTDPAYSDLMSTLDPSVARLKGLAEGLLSGTVSLAVGVAMFEVAPVAAVAVGAYTLGKGAYKIASAMRSFFASDQTISDYVKKNWQSFLATSPEDQGKMIGVLTMNVVGTIYNPSTSSNATLPSMPAIASEATAAGSLLAEGTRLAVEEEALAEAASVAEAAGTLSTSVGEGLTALGEDFPDETAALLKREPITDLAKDLTGLTPQTAAGILKLAEMAPEEVQGAIRDNVSWVGELISEGSEADKKIDVGIAVNSTNIDGFAENVASLEKLKQSYGPAQTQNFNAVKTELTSLGADAEGKTVALYSGGVGQAGALAWVKQDPANRIMIDQTPAGQYLASIQAFSNETGLGEAAAKELWTNLSLRFIQSAKGEIEVFIGDGGINNSGSILWKELGSLLKRDDILRIGVTPIKSSGGT